MYQSGGCEAVRCECGVDEAGRVRSAAGGQEWPQNVLADSANKMNQVSLSYKQSLSRELLLI
jgi:hypothetical protein